MRTRWKECGTCPEGYNPEEDFCLFALFPHRQLVFAYLSKNVTSLNMINETNFDQMSCSLFYLILYLGYGSSVPQSSKQTPQPISTFLKIMFIWMPSLFRDPRSDVTSIQELRFWWLKIFFACLSIYLCSPVIFYQSINELDLTLVPNVQPKIRKIKSHVLQHCVCFEYFHVLNLKIQSSIVLPNKIDFFLPFYLPLLTCLFLPVDLSL